MPTTPVSNKTITEALRKTGRWCKQQSYKGYNKHDGLNSPLLHWTLGWHKWLRIVAIQGVMRFPVNIRPLLLVKKVFNPKGLALFTQAYLNQFQTDQDQQHLDEALYLLELIEKTAVTDTWRGMAWGYHYPWQDPGFFAPSNTPNAVVSSFVCEAHLQAYRITQNESYLDKVAKTIEFFMQHLKRLKDTDSELCLSYMPFDMTMRVMDVSILIAAVMAQYIELTGDQTYQDTAYRLANYVAQQQTDYGAWYYTDPKEDSHITHDNYHTGFILDAFSRFGSAVQSEKLIDYDRGLNFYAEHLFNPDGTPRWMSDKDFPHDIHGAAQGIITFSRHLDKFKPLVLKIISWCLQHMWHPEGRFYYQQTPYFTKKFTLLRWCNGWMMKALSDYLYYNKENIPGVDE